MHGGVAPMLESESGSPPASRDPKHQERDQEEERDRDRDRITGAGGGKPRQAPRTNTDSLMVEMWRSFNAGVIRRSAALTENTFRRNRRLKFNRGAESVRAPIGSGPP